VLSFSFIFSYLPQSCKTEVDVVFIMVNVSLLSMYVSLRWQVFILLYEYNGKSSESLSSSMLHAQWIV